MSFTPIALSGLVLAASPRQDVDHVSISLTPPPCAVWLSRFAGLQFAPGQMSATLGSVGKPSVNGASIEFDAYVPQVAARITELKAAVASINNWFATVHEPALAAKAASEAAASALRAKRQAELNALLEA